jgi:hypothetical protein
VERLSATEPEHERQDGIEQDMAEQFGRNVRFGHTFDFCAARVDYDFRDPREDK